MTSRHIWLTLYAALMLLGIVELAACYPHLPERMATHFDAVGHPDDWMNKGMFLGVTIVAYLVVTAITVGLALLMPIAPEPWLKWLVTLPRRDYWLAPERRELTLEKVTRFTLVVGCLTLTLLILAIHFTIRANLSSPPELTPWFLYVVEAYLVVVLWMTARLAWYFARAE